jgi:hypothetical protein
MTITRRWQSGWELNTVAEWRAEITRTNVPDISSIKAYTGTYSLRNFSTSEQSSIGATFPSTTQIAAHLFFNHSGVNTGVGDYAIIFLWTSTAGNLNYIRWNGNSGNLELVLNNVVVATISAASAGITNTDTWYSAGLRVFANGSTGYVNFYIDGVSVLSATNQDTGTGLTALYVGGSLGGAIAGWNGAAYFDDCYVDDTAGEADSAPIARRFVWAIAAGNGTNSQWSGSDGNSIDNYLLVDDVTPDDDTTSVFTMTVSQKDTYAIAGITVPNGYTIAAAIPTALGKRAGSTEQLKLLAFDGASTTTGSAQNPSADYAPVWERMTTQPDASAWNEADFEAMEFGFESDGAF